MTRDPFSKRPASAADHRRPFDEGPKPGVLPGLAAWALVAFAGPAAGAAGAGLAAVAIALGAELWSGITGRASMQPSPIDTLIMFGYGFFGAYALGFFVSALAGIYFGIRAGMARWFGWREAALAGLAMGVAVLLLIALTVPARSLAGGIADPREAAFLFLVGAIIAPVLCRQLMIAFGILLRPPQDEDEDEAP